MSGLRGVPVQECLAYLGWRLGGIPSAVFVFSFPCVLEWISLNGCELAVSTTSHVDGDIEDGEKVLAGRAPRIEHGEG